MFLNHSVMLLVFFHWLYSLWFAGSLLICSRILLLNFPSSFLYGFINLHIGLLFYSVCYFRFFAICFASRLMEFANFVCAFLFVFCDVVFQQLFMVFGWHFINVIGLLSAKINRWFLYCLFLLYSGKHLISHLSQKPSSRVLLWLESRFEATCCFDIILLPILV